jgi:L-ascorbate metabolism protein UlaG (beta-lactamase superfamily)
LNPEDAVRAFLDLDARWLVPVHWGCFDLAFEPLDLPPKLLEKAVAQEPALNADRVRILAVGERWEIPGS